MPSPFPDLPIITPPGDERLSTPEKYGALFYLGLAGLAALVGMIVWFAYGVAMNWSMWTNIYILHDAKRPEAERIVAADSLASDSRMNQRQYWDIVMRDGLPPIARYRLAEALNAEATSADPDAYAAAVVESTAWPEWLRVLIARPMLYAVNRGVDFADEPIRLLTLRADPFLSLIGIYVQSLQRGGDPRAQRMLEQVATQDGPARATALLLVKSLHEKEPERTRLLDEASRGLREAMPAAAELWRGWSDKIGK
ncbi:MAG: hypothetical protein SFX72_12740 [Isosphaeraceae bacterium]|nr:hypothetical protein [Isosphaeraceae bacterium]